MKSRFLKLSARDILIGILMAFMTSILSGVIELLDKGAVFTWLAVRPILIAGLSAALSYLLKCFITNSRDEFFTREPKVIEG
ncbi:MAG: hypothetical protein JXL81_14655 [Deltaproteobacteria bacterium]|nr:hypothetical protein [Deltaproteobacteria bacterium]